MLITQSVENTFITKMSTIASNSYKEADQAVGKFIAGAWT
jgi:hypothetical protein